MAIALGDLTLYLKTVNTCKGERLRVSCNKR